MRRCIRVVAALLLVAAAGGCASDRILPLPPPAGLPDLTRLEEHLDYVDPDAGRPTYQRGGR